MNYLRNMEKKFNYLNQKKLHTLVKKIKRNVSTNEIIEGFNDLFNDYFSNEIWTLIQEFVLRNFKMNSEKIEAWKTILEILDATQLGEMSNDFQITVDGKEEKLFDFFWYNHRNIMELLVGLRVISIAFKDNETNLKESHAELILNKDEAYILLGRIQQNISKLELK